MTEQDMTTPDVTTDPGIEPAPEPTPAPMPDGRVLTGAEADAYTARLAAVGYAFSPAAAPEPVGFDVRATDGSVSFGYRYDASATTAVALMDRICGERGA